MNEEHTPDGAGRLEAMLSEAARRVGARAALLARDDGTLLAAVGDLGPYAARRLAASVSGAVAAADLMSHDLALGAYVAPAAGCHCARICARRVVAGRLLVTIFDDLAPAQVRVSDTAPLHARVGSRFVCSDGGSGGARSRRRGANGPSVGHRTTGCSGARATVTSDSSSVTARAR